MSRNARALTLALVALLAIAIGAALVSGALRPEAIRPEPIPSPTVMVTPSQSPSPSPTASAQPAEPVPTVVPGTTLTPCPRTGPGLLRVLTFNIHSGLRGATPDLETIAAEIGAIDPDVVLLQEVDRFRFHSRGIDQPAWLAERLGMEQAFGLNVLRSGGVGRPTSEYGTAILSKRPIIDASHLSLPQPRGTQQRGLQRVLIRVARQDVAIYNTHLEHTSQTARAAQMRAIVTQLGADPLPKILGGDLNSAPGGEILRLAEHVLDDAWTGVGVGAGLTAPNSSPRVRIDYLLYTPPWRPLAAQTHQSTVSDHRAVAVDFHLSTLPSCD